MSGWPVFWLLAAIETTVFAGALYGFGTEEAGLRAVVRLTVRVSFTVFIAVYSAAPLRRLHPSPATRWLLCNRRYLGVSFAWAHGLHALAIALLAVRLGDAFETGAVTVVGGGLGYLLTAGMALTSFDRTARWLGPRRWALLHRGGLHWLWIIFALNWTGAEIGASPIYLLFATATWAAAGLRLAAVRAPAHPGADRPGRMTGTRGVGAPRPAPPYTGPGHSPRKGCHRDPALFAPAAWIGAFRGRCALGELSCCWAGGDG